MTAHDVIWKSDSGRIEVARVGMIEVRSRRGYRWADGYAVIRDGLVQYPWMQKREALRDARTLAARGA